MEKDFEDALPAIWLVFGGSYLNHSNAPAYSPDHREKVLVDLLSSHLKKELVSISAKQLYGSSTLAKLSAVYKFLQLWSQDLEFIHKIREGQNNDSLVRQLARRFLKRIQTFENCTIIPTGLISALLDDTRSESVSLAVLRKRNGLINWVQVNPGSSYHQHCKHIVGEKSNAYLEITEINPYNITEDWLYLLVGLKAVRLENERYYKDVSLYECLLAQLNGKTVFQSQSDEGFNVYCHSSPVHTWQVVDQSFRYFVQNFLGDTYREVYHHLIINFKLSLMEETLAAYQGKVVSNQKQCHFLLQEMCRDVAQHALNQGSEEQSLQLINTVKAEIELRCSQQEQLVCCQSQLNEPFVHSLGFVAPKLVDYSYPTKGVAPFFLQVDPIFVKPSMEVDIIDYLEELKPNFINRLVNSRDLNRTALLSYGIEVFFIDYLAKTNILEKLTGSPFSRNDAYLADTLLELAGIYYGCQTRLVTGFLSNMTYQPQFYAKNVTVQFFVYAAIAALNYRNPVIGPLLADYNLSVDLRESLTFTDTIPNLVIEESRWVKVLLDVRKFFMSKKRIARTLFSSTKFTFEIKNDADAKNNDVLFAYQLMCENPSAFSRFSNAYSGLEDELLNRCWAALTYSDLYLPSLYISLSKVAYLAKVSLTGFPASTNSGRVSTAWAISHRVQWQPPNCYYRSTVTFKINKSSAEQKVTSDILTSYLIKSSHQSGKDPYQKIITCKEKGLTKTRIHFLENEIIASQDAKPETMDRNHYMQLGLLQSNPELKFERLYIALKEKQLDFSCKEEGILIKQTLFEISLLLKIDEEPCSLLEWTALHNPTLIHEFGLLCIEKARVMQHRLTQHHAIGDILLVTLGLLTFYPVAYKDTFIQGIVDIYSLLKNILAQQPAHLSDSTLMHLNAYLLIAVQAKPQLIEMDLLTVLNALVAIQNFKVKGSSLDNSWSLRVCAASFFWCPWVERQLEQDLSLLNDLMLSVIPQWDRASSWQKKEAELLFSCNDYAIKPLLGCIYFKNQPIMGLPDTITGHSTFKKYLGQLNFPVIPSSYETNTRPIPCYLSVDRRPQLRLTSFGKELIIEEWIDNNYQRYIPAKELLGHSNYPGLFYELPLSRKELRHWLDNKKNILIKDEEQRIVFKWDLSCNFLFSMKHQGYVVPMEQVQSSFFKTWLERIESPAWIELIAKSFSSSSSICIQSLNFPRLGLHFGYKEDKFFSKQVHGYVIAKQQHLNTLHGFTNYLVLEFKEENSVQKQVKVIIPHRKILPEGPFYAKNTIIDHNEILSPTYFVYDYDPKIGLLKGHHIRAHLYLALLYFCTASLDDHDASHCNPYHLARDNLELCWKDQPYDCRELDIIEQLLNISTMRCLHSNLIALYLKVVSLLSSSLFMDEAAQLNKKRSEEILQNCAEHLPNLLLIYFQNKSTVLARIRLSPDEEKDVMKHCSESLPSSAKKSYNSHYRELFSKQAQTTTAFLQTFKEHRSQFSFGHDKQAVDFSSGISGILIHRFRIEHFMTLYKLAKSSSVSVTKYGYLLHHLLIRAKINYESFPAELVKMLGRALLLVAENPTSFPDAPNWFNGWVSVDLSKRRLIKAEVLQGFPSLKWMPQIYLDPDQNEKAKEIARQKDRNENNLIWSLLATHDLNEKGVPRCLPENPGNFALQYENYINFSDPRKQTKVREHYLQAAYNNAMNQFFVSILQQCDMLKYGSKMGWIVAPFVHNTITTTFKGEEEQSLTIPEPVSLTQWAIPEEPLIDLKEFFAVNSQPALKNDFLFESQLQGLKNGYQHQFYSELKNSWLAYINEAKCSYSWLTAQSVNELESMLQTKYYEIHHQAEQIWDQIAAQFKQRSNAYLALRFYSGQVRHYHKGDILRLLIEPHKLPSYNPDCLQKKDFIIQELLRYVLLEIKSSKIVRALALIEQYKQAETEPEQFSMLQSLVRSLQENVDPESYCYPHWLLFQFENEIIIRGNQRELIVAMLSQSEKAMYQLNMGEGKSSVILPLLCYSLADGKQLLRVNVLSALSMTMKELLHQRFSGLIRKQVYTLPFNRDTDISTEHLKLVFETLLKCQKFQHILLVTPEQRLCLQLKIRELLLENQQQIGATNIFNWKTYRQRAHFKTEMYEELNEKEIQKLLLKQDLCLRTCLCNEQYIDLENNILKIPPRGQGHKEFARFIEIINDSEFKEWSCLKAAYRELLYNSTLAYKDCSEKLALLDKIGAITAIDLLDESDEILKHGTELNYTVGDKHVFAGGDLRWQIPQFFIKAIFCDPELRDIITAGKSNGFTTINLHFSSQGGVPFIQFLDESYYENSIKPILIDKFFQENLPTLRKYHCSDVNNSLVEGETSSLRLYIAGEVSPSTEKKVMEVLANKGSLKDKVLIAKGWLSHGILFHVFNAKYRVQYGLNLNMPGQKTKQIAVPFYGKDTPSPRSEFSHPDIMLGFTIVSYLYQGLDQEQLKKTLNKLKSKFSHHVADTHLSSWTNAGRGWIERHTDKFPPLLLMSFQHLDLADEQCLKQIHQYLSGNFMAIFFYLNQFVLLEEAMQYLLKISANAHSLVGYDAALGFSGTDDRKITMPFQIKSLCSKTQEGTNGKLLSVLTQERNSNYFSLETEDTVDLLRKLSEYVGKQPNCRALIDAGALVTGLSNYAVAEFLLAHLPSDFLGILYFNDEGNSLTVLTRDKKIVALQDCFLDKRYLFAYLDDIHTRGTDIKLPLNCHAILTVGMGMQKDKLMQAAMRLRQLAQKQSVSLWGTQAVTLAIARDNSVNVSVINSLEVIKWVTRNTIDSINADLYPVAVRKINFQFLKKAEALLREAPTTMDSLIQFCQEKELFRLEDFYASSPKREDLADWLYWYVSARLRTFWQGFEQEMESKKSSGIVFNEKVFNQSDKSTFRNLLFDICQELQCYLQSGYVHDSLDNDEEKEVEVEVEVIQEQEVVINVENRIRCSEKPWDARLILQEDFITLAEQQNIIMPLKKIKHFIQIPADLKSIIWHCDIYMTTNFIHTVKCLPNEMLDNYLRPVDVVLMHHFNDKSIAVLLSGQEASRIKFNCFKNLGSNKLIHINDIDGTTQLPVDISVSKEEQKLLTIVKLFSGECNYTSLKEVQRLSKRVGRIYPRYFACTGVSSDFAEKLYGILVEERYLDFAGIMTEKLLKVLCRVNTEDSLPLNLPDKYQSYNQFLLKKLFGIFSKLIISSSNSLKDSHDILRQWLGTRGRLREYPGSALESILNPEFELKCSQ